MIERRWDAIVVGAGHNGLVAAAYLARAGRRVLVCERSPEIGGATASRRLFAGHDARLSRYSYLVSLLPQSIVSDLGLRLRLLPRPVDGCAPYRGADGSPQALLIHNDRASTDRALFEFGGERAVREWRRFSELSAALAPRIYAGMTEPLRTRAQWEGELGTRLEREAWRALVEEPLGDALERLVDHDVLRGIIFSDAKIGVPTWPHDPSLLQNRTYLLHVVGRGTGEWRVPGGGMGAVADEIAGAATRAGAQLLCGARVVAVEPDPERVDVAIEVAGERVELESEWLLAGCGEGELARLTGRSHTPQPEDEGSVAKLNLLLGRLPRLRAPVSSDLAFAGTFRLDEGYEQMKVSYRQARAGELPDRLPAEIYCHTLTDRSILGESLRRSGAHTLTIFGLDVHHSAVVGRTGDVAEELRQRYVNRLNTLLAEPLEDCLLSDADGQPCIECLTAADLERELGLEQGNIFHTAPSWPWCDDRTAAGGWGVETADPRVLICGSAALRGGAVSGIPGHNAARAVLSAAGQRG